MRSAVLPDLFAVAAGTLAFFVFAVRVELFEGVASWTRRHEAWELDELALTLLVLCAGLAWFGWRRLREQARLQAAMQAALQQNRALSRQLLRLQEDERSRIARELHDELAQQCVGIRVEAAAIEDEARARGLHGVGDGARAIRESIDRLHGVVREMLTRLRPPMLDALGLEASLRSLAAAWSRRHGIACSVEVDACCETATDELRVALYRVAQEALTNVARHAAASHVRLVLQAGRDANALLLTVDDDGRGLASPAPPGLGLVGMAERLAAVGGSLVVSASPVGGLRIAAEVPA